MVNVICRACLDSEKSLVSTDTTTINNYNLLTNLQATTSDDKPQFFCCTCYQNIEQFIIFRDKCIQSDNTLKALKVEVKIKVEDKQLDAYDHYEEETILYDTDDDIKPEITTLNMMDPCAHIPSTSSTPMETEDALPSTSAIPTTAEKNALRNHIWQEPTQIITRSKRSTRARTNKDTKKKGVPGCVTDMAIRSKPAPIKTKTMKIKSVSNKDSKKDVLGCGLCTENIVFNENENWAFHIDSHNIDNICKICKEHFTEWPTLLGHRVKHLQRGHQKCHICGKYFPSEIGMEFHYRNEHLKEKHGADLRCKWCSKLFCDPSKYSRHIERVHAPLKTLFACEICSKTYKWKRSLDLHSKVHGDKKDFVLKICNQCGASFDSATGLSYHVRKIHLKMVFCNKCNKGFKDMQILGEHKCLMNYRLCPICGKNVISNRIKKHMRVHSDVGIFKCSRCPAKFKSSGALRAHNDRHDGRKRYQCDVCPLKVYTYSSLIRHKRIHTGERPYKCKVCNKGFTGGHNLKVHMKVHGEFLVKKKGQEPE